MLTVWPRGKIARRARATGAHRSRPRPDGDTTAQAIRPAGPRGAASAQLAQPRDQARGVPAGAAHGLHLLVELVDQRRDRQARPGLVGGGEADPQILAHPVDGKAEVEFARLHRLSAVRHLPAARRALADRLDHIRDRQPGLLGEMQRLGEPLHQPRDGDLVAHLGQLAGAGLAHPPAGLGIGRNHRLGRGIIRLGAAAHHRQHAVLGPRLPARDRRVDKAKAHLSGQRRQFARDLGRHRGVVDEDRVRPHAGESALVAETDGAQVVVIADAGHDEIGARGGRGRRGRGAPAMARHPGLGLGRRAVVDRHLMPLRRQMPRHREPHHPEPQKCHLRHGPAPAFLRETRVDHWSCLT
ncbi:hypothetical protein SDC9_25088 [bioreactor metagenome]|uniref:Uncharacterized protein n=1 Tax=bioreactor metagenome TaxID=1076179 RepID=A0A644UKA2_9ZZZZ